MGLFLPIILIAISLAVVIFLFAKNFSKLIILDVDTIPEVKSEVKKDEILKQRVEKRSHDVGNKWWLRIKPIIEKLKNLQVTFRKYVASIKEKADEETVKGVKASGSVDDRRRKRVEARGLVREADILAGDGDHDEAERKYITAIKLDPKSKTAYQGLAKIYYSQDQKLEAKETYKFLLHLDPENEVALLRLGEMFEEEGDLEKAVDYYQQTVLVNPHNSRWFAKVYDLLLKLKEYRTALEAIEQALSLEPQNPKYLDNFVEISIILEDKKLAQKGYEQLRMVNPENQKLVSFKQRIGDL